LAFPVLMTGPYKKDGMDMSSKYSTQQDKFLENV